MESMHDLEILINTGRPLIVLETEREGCFIEGFRRLAKRSGKAYFQWTITQGLLRLAPDYNVQPLNKDVNQLFAQIHSSEQPAVYVLVDFHHQIDQPVAIRHIKDVLLHSPQHTIILLSQKIQLPEELKTVATYYELPLPTEQQLVQLVDDLAVDYFSQFNNKLRLADKKITARLVANLCGLSFADARRMAHHAIFNDGVIDQSDIEDIAKQKFKLLNSNNVLSLELDYAELEDIAGFDKLKHWLQIRKQVFTREITLPGGDIPKGILLLGVQGCGKSLAAKAVAGSWGLPLLHLDFGTLYNRFYGQTEENLRTALSAAVGMQPCVLWIDEIEKGLSAVSASDDVSKRLLGTFLTWLAEKKDSVFVVATANNVTTLPPELLRKGRFDEVFFVDLPRQKVRQEILRLHLQKRQQSLANIDLEELAKRCAGFSGAEIEQVVVAALYQTIAARHSSPASDDSSAPQSSAASELSSELLLEQINATQPLSVLMKEKVVALRAWAQNRTVSV